MTRLLVFLINGSTGEIEVEFGRIEEIKKAARNYRASDKGNQAITCPVEGPEVNIQALEVAWTLQDEVLEKRGEKSGGLQTVLLQTFLLGLRARKKEKNKSVPSINTRHSATGKKMLDW